MPTIFVGTKDPGIPGSKFQYETKKRKMPYKNLFSMAEAMEVTRLVKQVNPRQYF
jgi:hypothetical protein